MAGDKGEHMSSKCITLVILLVAALLLVGCAGSITDQPIQNDGKASPGAAETETGLEPSVPSETPDRSEQRPAQTPPPGLERVEITPLEPVTGEVPTEIMEQIIADLVERSGTEAARDYGHQSGGRGVERWRAGLSQARGVLHPGADQRLLGGAGGGGGRVRLPGLR